MSLPQGFERRAAQGDVALVRADLASLPFAELWQDGEPLDGARGRGGARAFTLFGARGPVAAVARDYRRGGLFGALLGAVYLDRERAERELSVLATLRARGLPVVEPLAALCRRAGAAYRLRLLTERFEHALPLPRFVAEHPALRRAAVREAGAVVGAAFAAGLVHRDLHVDNLIARQNGAGVEVRLLDLDRASLRDALPERVRDAMLLRAGRYCRRHAARLGARPVDELRFLAGCGSARAARRELIERLAPKLARIVARHRFGWR